MIYFILALIVLGIILSFIRLILGKYTENRVVAIDIITTLITGLLVVYAHISGNSLMLDVALVYGILSFIAVIVMARYLEGGL
ncbi:MAG: monovalent cation/H+ antiporter complex subunit F [Clostridiaceae bacterium]